MKLVKTFEDFSTTGVEDQIEMARKAWDELPEEKKKYWKSPHEFIMHTVHGDDTDEYDYGDEGIQENLEATRAYNRMTVKYGNIEITDVREIRVYDNQIIFRGTRVDKRPDGEARYLPNHEVGFSPKDVNLQVFTDEYNMDNGEYNNKWRD